MWDDDEVNEKKRDLPNLEVTTAWCIENHLCEPTALGSALNLSVNTIQQIVTSKLDGWISYGSIWWTLQRLRTEFAAALPSSDFGHPLKDACDPLTEQAKLLGRLGPYDSQRISNAANDVVRKIQDRQRAIGALPAEARLAEGVHGKRFFFANRSRLPSARQQDSAPLTSGGSRWPPSGEPGGRTT